VMTHDATAKLTPRQYEVLALLANGYSVGQVARALSVSAQTVKNHVGKAYTTLRVPNRTRAFIELGWLTPPSAPEHRVLEVSR